MGQRIREEIARPYLAHIKRPKLSTHVPKLKVISFDDLLLAKISAFSTRGFGRDLVDLLAIDMDREIDWARWLRLAAKSDDNDFNPSEFTANLETHFEECGTKSYMKDLPVRVKPDLDGFRKFIRKLIALNSQLVRIIL